MIKLARTLAVIASGVAVLSSCKQDDDVSVSGPGITRQIRSFENYACSGGTVTRYEFQNAEVFLFDTNCGINDDTYPIYDIDGNQICYIGGFGGISDCRGNNFYREAKNPTVIFTKP